MDLVSFAAAVYLIKTFAWIPITLGVGVAIVGYKVYQGMKETSSAIGDALEDASENRSRSKAFNLLSKKLSPAESFGQKPRNEQSSLLFKWLATAESEPNSFGATQIQNILPCMELYSKEKSMVTEEWLAKGMLSFLKRFASSINESTSIAIMDNIFASLAKPRYVTIDTLKLGIDTTRHYTDMMQPHHEQACRDFVVEAVKLTDLNRSNGNFECDLKLLETLYQPMYSHGGHRGTMSLSIEKGGYSEEQRQTIDQHARSIANKVERSLANKQDEYSWRQRDRKAAEETVKAVKAATTGNARPYVAPARAAAITL